MEQPKTIQVVYKNDLNTYLSDWKNTINIISTFERSGPDKIRNHLVTKYPAPFAALSRNSYDLSLLLKFLDERLGILEESFTLDKFNDQAYAEASTFIKACFIFFRILLDDLSGIINYFYKKNEKIEWSNSFDGLLKQSKKRKFPNELSKLLEKALIWFPEAKTKRDDLVHNYDSILIIFKQGENGKNIIGHMSGKMSSSNICDDTRKYFGFILGGYQKLIDDLLDLFDIKFKDWYGIVQSDKGRNLTIIEDGIMLWWAYKYGNYRHKDLRISESDTQ